MPSASHLGAGAVPCLLCAGHRCEPTVPHIAGGFRRSRAVPCRAVPCDFVPCRAVPQVHFLVKRHPIDAVPQNTDTWLNAAFETKVGAVSIRACLPHLVRSAYRGRSISTTRARPHWCCRSPASPSWLAEMRASSRARMCTALRCV
jgi:hypothetical protein